MCLMFYGWLEKYGFMHNEECLSLLLFFFLNGFNKKKK